MATLTAQTQLTVSGINSDDMALDVTMTPTVLAGGIISKTITAKSSGSAVEILYAAHYAAGTIVYLRNTSTSETAHIELTSGTEHLTIGASQWAVFPWKAATDMKAHCSDDLVLEVGVFSAT